MAPHRRYGCHGGGRLTQRCSDRYLPSDAAVHRSSGCRSSVHGTTGRHSVVGFGGWHHIGRRYRDDVDPPQFVAAGRVGRAHWAARCQWCLDGRPPACLIDRAAGHRRLLPFLRQLRCLLDLHRADWNHRRHRFQRNFERTWLRYAGEEEIGTKTISKKTHLHKMHASYFFYRHFVWNVRRRLDRAPLTAHRTVRASVMHHDCLGGPGIPASTIARVVVGTMVD